MRVRAKNSSNCWRLLPVAFAAACMTLFSGLPTVSAQIQGPTSTLSDLTDPNLYQGPPRPCLCSRTSHNPLNDIPVGTTGAFITKPKTCVCYGNSVPVGTNAMQQIFDRLQGEWPPKVDLKVLPPQVRHVWPWVRDRRDAAGDFGVHLDEQHRRLGGHVSDAVKNVGGQASGAVKNLGGQASKAIKSVTGNLFG